MGKNAEPGEELTLHLHSDGGRARIVAVGERPWSVIVRREWRVSRSLRWRLRDAVCRLSAVTARVILFSAA